MAEELDFILRAINETQQDIEKLKTDLSDVQKQTESLETTNESAGFSFTELNSAFSIASQAIGYVSQAYDATIAKTLEYGDTVRNLSRQIGASAEDTSRLIQAADDVQVSSESLTAALTIATKKGLDPTIEGLGKMADEYNKIQDPIARSRFLMEQFGKSGNDLAPLLEKGSTGIKALGEEADKTGQVMSGRALQAQRDFEVGIDNVQDHVQGLTYTLSNEALPALTSYLDAFDGRLSLFGEMKAAIDANVMSWGDEARIGFEVQTGLLSVEDATHQVDQAMQVSIDRKTADIAALTNWRDETDKAAAAESALGSSTTGTNSALDTSTTKGDAYAQSMNDSAAAVEALQKKQEGWAGQTATSVVSALEQAGVKGQAYADALGAVDTALGTNKAADAQHQKDIDTITEQYAKGQISVEQFQAALTKMSNEDSPAAIKAHQDEAAALDELHRHQATLTSTLTVDFPNAYRIGTQAIQSYSESLDQQNKDGGPVYSYIIGLSKIEDAAKRAAQAVKDIPALPGGGAAGAGAGPQGHVNATGADYTVPPGYPGESWNLGTASSGEKVKITPVGGNSSVSKTDNMNITIVNNTKVDADAQIRLLAQSLQDRR